MRKFYFLLVTILLPFVIFAQSKPYDIIIKGGHVIDPKNNINSVMDVAILNGKIAKVAVSIDAAQAPQVVVIGHMLPLDQTLPILSHPIPIVQH